MFGRKAGFLAMTMLTLALFSGCTNGKVDEAKARNWYNEMQGNGSVTNDTMQDGYGNYTGGPNWGTDNTERNTYGMRTDNGNTLGQDIRNAWDNVKDGMTGNNNAGGNNTGNNR